MKYFINDAEVSELHFDIALNEYIADYVYDNYEEDRDRIIDDMYESAMTELVKCGTTVIDKTKFSMVTLDK